MMHIKAIQFVKSYVLAPPFEASSIPLRQLLVLLSSMHNKTSSGSSHQMRTSGRSCVGVMNHIPATPRLLQVKGLPGVHVPKDFIF